MSDKKLRELMRIYESMEHSPKEASSLSEIPYVEVVPRMEKDYACPYCHELWREKDYSFKYHPELNAYTHCNGKPFRMLPSNNSLFKESFESSHSGFEKDGVGEASQADKDKIDAVVNSSKYPDESEVGKAYVVMWADGRGIFACRYKSYLPKWLKEQGEWSEIVSIKYEDPKKLKVINKK